jgi:adenosylmethionine-8-amino-7-oxononanoate aminotransferase
VQRSLTVGARLQNELLRRLSSIAYVGCVQGLGLLTGVELVADKSTRAPFPRERKVAERIAAYLFERGLIVWPNVGQADGTHGDLFMIGPPLVIDEEQADELASTLAETLEEFTP